jgi:hypothetical protein
MKLQQILNELQAEIVGGKVPPNKVFDLKGNVIPSDKIKSSEFLPLLKEIKAAIEKAGILDQFSADKGEIDIKPFRKNEYLLSPENGPQYVYNFATKRLTKKSV